MPPLQAVRTANASYRPSFRPVALFVGGTSGVGQGTAERFAQYAQGNAHIILCGRNKAAAEEIISRLPKTEQSKYEFVACDATLMSEITRVSGELKQRLGKLNYLVLSQGIMTMQGRTETAEGMDRKMALHFYGRWKFVFELMPLLEKAKEQGEEARVETILAAGMNGKVDWEDLDLKKGYSLLAAANHCTTGNDIMIDEMARRYPKISFIHMAPGAVRTNILTHSWVGKLLLTPLAYPFTVSQETAGEWLVNPLLNPAMAAGAHWMGQHADDVGPNKYSTPETRKKLFEHVLSLTKTA